MTRPLRRVHEAEYDLNTGGSCVPHLAAVTDRTFASEVLQVPAAIVDFWADW